MIGFIVAGLVIGALARGALTRLDADPPRALDA
ncbi:hypothetical protein Xcel_1868 [Xylanimonas cellulosilytica DSM 15894]|uniref:Uncharacterized protein n=1 Tax=Xylanimonas cellulosilytica (strain DSM 15894 / JCM 12276 / CECT 5975 / KCTC 9989 / LMG 20990 / NBRC 107835 / XIL07) TaxID=446471 RepID=D1BT46_XYLCX|nr:hypothetical protein Xcel_1868 [Xylanimonas cellulosilytica DSM 15894]